MCSTDHEITDHLEWTLQDISNTLESMDESWLSEVKYALASISDTLNDIVESQKKWPLD